MIGLLHTHLGLSVVLNFGKLICKILQAVFQVGCLHIRVEAHLSDQQVTLVPQSCRFTYVPCEKLAQLPEVLLHVCDALLDLLGLGVSLINIR